MNRFIVKILILILTFATLTFSAKLEGKLESSQLTDRISLKVEAIDQSSLVARGTKKLVCPSGGNLCSNKRCCPLGTFCARGGGCCPIGSGQCRNGECHPLASTCCEDTGACPLSKVCVPGGCCPIGSSLCSFDSSKCCRLF